MSRFRGVVHGAAEGRSGWEFGGEDGVAEEWGVWGVLGEFGEGC